MISIKATAIRNSDENSEESDLKISVKPLRVNIDQDTLLFLVEFFTTVIATISSEESENPLNTIPNNQMNNNLPTYDEVMPFNDTESNVSDATQETTVTNSSSNTLRNATNFSSSNSNKVFFKSFSFSPDVPIRLDYNGKHVDFDKVLILLLEYCF
jgi:autophagy-related protein 2